MQKTKLTPSTSRTPKRIVYSTTDGRQRFPDILQVSYGEKAVIGFDRYGRTLGAVVPMEAVLMLAGKTGDVDQDVQARIERAARQLLSEIGGFGDPVSLEDLDAERASELRDSPTPPLHKRKKSG